MQVREILCAFASALVEEFAFFAGNKNH